MIHASKLKFMGNFAPDREKTFGFPLCLRIGCRNNFGEPLPLLYRYRSTLASFVQFEKGGKTLDGDEKGGYDSTRSRVL